MKRRTFVVATSAASVGAALAVWFRVKEAPPSVPQNRGLVRDPKGVLDLPKGFRYRVVERAGETMSDGYRVPGRPDAMACFALKNGQFALMRNHELDRGQLELGAYTSADKAPSQAYDPHSAGGVSRVVLDARGERVSSNLVLAGTSRNCAAGMSPWGFLTCEETVEPGHGYVFLCSPEADEVRPAQRITAYGRFQHEAVAIDPATNAAYLTEDRPDSCLYRFVPRDRQKPFGEGTLQALAIKGSPRFAIGDALMPGKPLPLSWVDVPAEAGEKEDGLRYAAHARGAAIIRRGEGIWYGHDGVYVTSTTGGPRSSGQILHVVPHGEGGTISLIAQADEHTDMEMPDNLTVTPWGDLLVCEDNQRDEYLRLVTRDGRVLPFAHNALSRSEFAGVCFSPNGRTVFVNIQEQGLTLAIEGPFASLSS